MRLLVVALILFVSGLTDLCAQTVSDTIPQNIPAEGTWQLQVINTRNQPLIPGDIEQLVAEKRAVSEIVYIQLGTDVRLKILPLAEIRRADFIPVVKIVHITE